MLMLMLTLMLILMLMLTLMLILMLMMDGCGHLGPQEVAHRGDAPVVHVAVFLGRLTVK